MEDIGVRAIIEGLRDYLGGMADMQKATEQTTRELAELQEPAEHATESLENMQRPISDTVSALEAMQQSTSDEAAELAAMSGAFTQTQEPMRQFEAQLQSMVEKAKEHANELRNMGAAMLAVGAAGLKLSEDSKKITASLGTTALTVGMTTDEMRDLADEVTTVSMRLGDSTQVLDLMARAGVRGREEMIQVARSLDALSTATGMAVVPLATMLLPAMKAYGVELENLGDYNDAFTYLQRNSTVELSEFGQALRYIAPDLRDLGISIEETVAVLMAMEARGLTSTAALRSMRMGVTAAKTEQISLNEALGISSHEIAEYTNAIKEADGITQAYAETNMQQYGFMARIGLMYDELKLKIGPLLEPMNMLFGIMTSMGTALIALSLALKANTFSWMVAKGAWLAGAAAKGIATVATWGLAAATWALDLAVKSLTAPIWLLIGAVLALVAAFALLIWKWDDITAFFRNLTVEITGAFRAIPEELPVPDIRAFEDTMEEIKRSVGDVGRAQSFQIDEMVRLNEQAYSDMLRHADAYYGTLRREDESLMARRRAQHAEELRVIDAETAALLAPLQARLDAIDEEAGAEKRQREDTEFYRRKGELYERRDQAETFEERERLWNQIQDLEARRRDTIRQRERADEQASLRTQMDDIIAQGTERKALAEERLEEDLARIDKERQAYIAAETEKYEAWKGYLEERMGLEDEEFLATQEAKLEHYSEFLDNRQLLDEAYFKWLREEEAKIQADLEEAMRWKGLTKYTGPVGPFPDESAIEEAARGWQDVVKRLVHLLTPGAPFKPPGAQYGAHAPYGGLYEVGERGRELVAVPPGASIIPNEQTINYNVTANYTRQQEPQGIAMDLEAIRMMTRV